MSEKLRAVCDAINLAVDKFKLDERSFGELFYLQCCEKGPEEIERSGKVYTIKENCESVVYCEEHTEQFKESFEYIDRRSSLKPREWYCDFCHIRNREKNPILHYNGCDSSHHYKGTALGGGCEWYTKDYSIDCCMECWNTLSGKKMLNEVCYIPGEKYCIGDDQYRFLKPKKVDVLDLYDPSEWFKGCDELRLDTEFNNIAGLNRITNSLVEAKGVDFMTENIVTWVPICEPVDLSVASAEFVLYVNLADPKLPICSGVWDDHGRLSLIRIFDNIESLMDAYKKFQESCPSKEDVEAMCAKIEEEDLYDFDLRQCSQSFAVFIREEKGLGIYFG